MTQLAVKQLWILRQLRKSGGKTDLLSKRRVENFKWCIDGRKDLLNELLVETIERVDHIILKYTNANKKNTLVLKKQQYKIASLNDVSEFLFKKYVISS